VAANRAALAEAMAPMPSQQICRACGGTGSAASGGEVICRSCGATLRFGDTIIEVQGNDAAEVQRVAGQLATQEAARRAEQWQAEKALAGPWSTGLFYLLAAVVLIGAVLAVAALAPLWVIPVVLVAAVVLLAVVGALQLRHDDKITEKGFLALMKLALSQTKTIARRAPPE
jgi:hypothetical protein